MRFSGLGGEAVRRSLTAGGLVALVPGAIATLVFSALLAWLAFQLRLPIESLLFTAYVAMSPVIGRYALAGRTGDNRLRLLASAVQPAAISRFVLRFSLLNLLWAVPCALALHWCVASVNPAALQQAPTRAVIAGVLFAAVVAVSSVVPTLALIVCTASDSTAQALSREKWQWLLNARRDDLVPLTALLLGGYLLQFFLLLIPLLIVAGVVFARNPELGQKVAFGAALLPWGYLPSMVGQLAGVFVWADSAPSTAPGTAPTTTPTTAPAQPAALEPVTPQALMAPVIATLPQAPDDPLGRIQQSLRAGDAAGAAAAATVALRMALASADARTTLLIYDAIAAERKHLQGNGAEFEQLGRLLVQRARFADGLWCLRASAVRGGKSDSVQKALIILSDAATQAGDSVVARQALEHFLKTYPQSPLAGYCQTALAKLPTGRA